MANAKQREYWTSASGDKWADMAERIDAAHAEVTAALVQRANVRAGDTVLDVGCGAGTSVRAFLVAGARVTGLDLSPRLLAHAEASLPEGAAALFIEGDAQEHPFEPATYDIIASQFGVMFFEDPVAAFENLRLAAKPGGRLYFVAWGAAEDNPWFQLPREASLVELGDIETDPDAPSPTAFRDIPRVEAILRDAGWMDVAGEAATIDITPRGTLAEAADQATRLGLAARIIKAHGADEAARARITARIVTALLPYEVDGAVRVPGCFNFFSASAPR